MDKDTYNRYKDYRDYKGEITKEDEKKMVRKIKVQGDVKDTVRIINRMLSDDLEGGLEDSIGTL